MCRNYGFFVILLLPPRRFAIDYFVRRQTILKYTEMEFNCLERPQNKLTTRRRKIFSSFSRKQISQGLKRLLGQKWKRQAIKSWFLGLIRCFHASKIILFCFCFDKPKMFNANIYHSATQLTNEPSVERKMFQFRFFSFIDAQVKLKLTNKNFLLLYRPRNKVQAVRCPARNDFDDFDDAFYELFTKHVSPHASIPTCFTLEF